MRPPRIAIVREPPSSFGRCVSTHPLRGQVNAEKAKLQHDYYCKTLRDLGLDLVVLGVEEALPDSCFVEDAVVVRGKRALLGRFAVGSRIGEETAVREVLRSYVQVGQVKTPATLEGGDVIHLPNSLVVGVGSRTNREGVRQLSDFLRVKVQTIEEPHMVHLKSHATYLGFNTFLSTRLLAAHPAFRQAEVILVPDDEPYAANTLAIGDSVLMSSRHKRTMSLVRAAGFRVIPLDLSEFEKCDGALTCLSILV